MQQIEYRAVLKGTGSAVPRTCVSNVELSKTVDTTDEWIFERTGIRYRYIAEADETSATLGAEAGRKAIEAAGLQPEDIDLVIFATVTPDSLVPSNANRVQAILGLGDCAAFDIAAACSGFIYSLSLVDALIRIGQAKHALVIGAETLSRMTDWSDRSTCILFGDGAGAMVLSAEAAEAEVANSAADSPSEKRGILASILHADGKYKDILYFDGGPSTTQTIGQIRMAGKELFRHAVTNLTNVLYEVMKLADISAEQIDWMIPHQANQRIIDACVQRLGIAPERAVVNISRYANTSAASIPITFDGAVRDGRIKAGDVCVMQAVGGGLTWGALVLRV